MRAADHPVGFPPALPAARPPARPARAEGSGRWVRRGVVAAAIALLTVPIWTSDGGALTAFGSREYRVSERAVADGEETVYAMPLFGSVEIVVPDGVAVEQGGLIVFGSPDCPACEDPADSTAPLVRVRTYGGFGSVEIRRVGQERGED